MLARVRCVKRARHGLITLITRFKSRLVIATREVGNVKKSDAEHNQSIRRRQSGNAAIRNRRDASVR
jgi:hypothetical protein